MRLEPQWQEDREIWGRYRRTVDPENRKVGPFGGFMRDSPGLGDRRTFLSWRG